MAAAVDSFSSWLGDKLKDLNTDENVFGSYITGILDSDDTDDEKNEALQGILSEFIENDNEIATACTEILDMWLKFKSTNSQETNVKEDMDVKLAKLLESQSLATTKQKEYTAEEKKIREAILSQYSQLSDDDEEADGAPQSSGLGDCRESNLEKNTNASTVMQAEKLKREQAKLESQKKKEKDKEDREKQKQLKEEKKEKRKTQKGERRR